MFVHKRVRTRPRKTKAYVNNKDFYEAILKYREDIATYKSKFESGENVIEPVIPRYIGECIMLICDKLSSKPNFYSYTYKDEMIADAIENCLAALKKNFDPNKSNNPFAYFTSIAWNAFIRRLNKERDQALAKAMNFERMFLISDEAGESFVLPQPSNNDYTDDLMRKHEAREAKKRKAPKVKRKKKQTIF